jgi:hypothetical protein
MTLKFKCPECGKGEESELVDVLLKAIKGTPLKDNLPHLYHLHQMPPL